MFTATDELLRIAVEAGFGTDAGRSVDRSAALVEMLPSTGGGSFNTTVQRISGTSNRTPWSVVVKRIEADPARPDWDREADVYADTGWLGAALPKGLRAPRLLASEQSTDGITLLLEDLPTSGQLTIEDLASAARLLTRFNASGQSPRPWWSAGFLTNEFHTLADHPGRLGSVRHQPHHEHLRQQLIEFSALAPGLVDTCRPLPHGPAHLDAYSRNLIVDRASDSIGLVDWANAGAAPLGTDPATLFILSLDYLDADIGTINELEQAIIDAMCAGLAGDGNAFEDAVAGFHAVVRLRHLAMMMNAFPMVERADPAVSNIIGRPLDQVVDQWLDVGEHLLRS